MASMIKDAGKARIRLLPSPAQTGPFSSSSFLGLACLFFSLKEYMFED